MTTSAIGITIAQPSDVLKVRVVSTKECQECDVSRRRYMLLMSPQLPVARDRWLRARCFYLN